MNPKYKRIIAMFFALNIIFETISPSVAFALTGGPSQPEVQSFTPVATSDMVNIFSGDFNYNIPLLDIDGYPVNLAYDAGIGTDEEASWVGLGWNINPGVVNRGMRGLPDDFNGENIHKETSMRPNQTVGVFAGFGFELFGKDVKKVPGSGFGSVSLNLGLNFNTYSGYGMDMGAKLALSGSKANKGSFGGSLGLSSGTGKGLGITADVSYSRKLKDNELNNLNLNKANASLGLSFNTVGGLTSLNFKAGASGDRIASNRKSSALKKVDVNGGFGYSFASPSYMPSSGPEMINMGLNVSVTFGAELFGVHGKATLGGYYSGQFIKDKTRDYKAYGFLHSESNQSAESQDILHDFNREKDVSFTMHTPNLPVTNYTYDSYNYSGQGISGDFRPHRNQVGTVFDPLVKNFPSISASVGIELGVGNTAHVGVNISLSYSRTKTGKWVKNNQSTPYTKFAGGSNATFEGVYFKQGGEKSAENDMAYFNEVINGFEPVRLGIQKAGANAICTNELTTKYGGTRTLSNNARTSRARRNESVNVLTGGQAEKAGLEKNIYNYPENGFQSFYSSGQQPVGNSRTSGTNISSHHISEITTLRNDGARYVYGIPAYNNKNKEANFAVNSNYIDYLTGQVGYVSGDDNTKDNKKGLDQYFDSQVMPGYAHAFLLNAVLSSDYVDRTQNGPSKDDLGKYTKFNYTKVNSGYKWRTPYTKDRASLNQALYSKDGPGGDDKASYNYGEKEIWYLHSIETKNYVAVFELDGRNDGLGVLDENGGQDASQTLRKLKEIRLYSRQELIDKGSIAVPLKTVHLEYDYSLCNGIENNINYDASNPSAVNTGKLTLKKVWFTYQNSLKGKLSPYEFSYADNDHNGSQEANFGYNPKSYDRWGNYKPNNPTSYLGTNHSAETQLLTSEFPYTSQIDSETDSYAAAWNLTKVKLPSGAEINVTYEADDYAYVQNKKAMEMHTVFGASRLESPVSNQIHDKLYDIVIAQKENFNHMFINLSPEEINEITSIPSANRDSYILNKFFRDENGNNIDYLYFKYLVNVERTAYTPKMEYISGYAKIDFSFAPTLWEHESDPLIKKLRFSFKEVSIYDNKASGQTTNPVTMAGINFVRRYMPQVAYDNNQDPYASAGSNLLGLLNGMKAAFTPIVQFFKGGLANALLLSNACQEFIPERSFVKLYSSDQFKKGGGARVKQLTLNDNWSTQTNNASSLSSSYGQIYDYVTKDGSGRTISSGVASYEPLIGGDENPFKKPVFYEEKHILAPDDDFYQEEPYGEAMFPGPSVGYSRIVVRNLERKQGAMQVSRHATGAVVHEFYTGKDFPTMTDRTDCKKERHKPNPVAKFLKFVVRDFMTTSQGYQVILNDMHGKPKAQWVYKEVDPLYLTNNKALEGYYGNNYISGIEYKYKRNLDQVNNDVQVINKNGQVNTGMVGVDYDMVVDTRESQTTSRVGNLQINAEAFFLGIFPGLVPTLWPGYSQEKIRYRSSVVTKVLYRYGLLEETIAYDNGAKVSTKNKLWDAETGEVLLTETVNNFSDPIYSLTYPSHWAYDRMGSASKNIGAISSISGGTVSQPNVLILGDEVLFENGNMGWVRSVAPTIGIVDNSGALINLNSHSRLTIIRSGNRNQQNIPIAKLASLVNPISGGTINLNANSKVLNASAAEFKDDWGIFCNCGTTSTTVVNPFLTGQKGIWRPSASYVYLTGRDQSSKNHNTNIRKDGAYVNYIPYWTPNAISPYNWEKSTDPTWQITSKMTMYSPYGFEIENIDALGRNSSALYGYGNTLPIAVSSNAKYNQIGFDGFEDYDYNNPCEDDHFSYIKYNDGSGEVIYNKSSNNYISKPSSHNQKYSHTGRKSIKVGVGAIITQTMAVTPACNPLTNAPIIY